MFAFIRNRKESQRLECIYGSGFEQSIGEMDKIAIEQTGALASDHVRRRQVITSYAIAYVRENPDIEEATIEMDARVWAMAAFTLCHGMMRPDGGFGTGSAIAAKWGITKGCSNERIHQASDWALMQISSKGRLK